jgi:hypothetical protein
MEDELIIDLPTKKEKITFPKEKLFIDLDTQRTNIESMIEFRTKIIKMAEDEDLYFVRVVEKDDNGEAIENKSFNTDTFDVISNVDETISKSYKELFDTYNKIMGMKQSLSNINLKNLNPIQTKDKTKKGSENKDIPPQRKVTNLFNMKLPD